MRIRRWSAAAALLLAASIGSMAEAGDAVRTDPRHLGRPLPPGQSFLDPTLWYPYLPRVVAREPKKKWRTAGKPNPRLSDACQRGEFREYATMRFRAIYEDAILGVAFGFGLNLIDPKGVADPTMIYYFRNANSTACMVLQKANPDPDLPELLRRRREQQQQQQGQPPGPGAPGRAP